ncbi:MAG: hypothetical protein AB7N71_02405 [Phycisphaerae bacterium]
MNITTTPKIPTRNWFFASAFLLALLLVTHIWSLWDGTVLDDHWHQKGLREHGWTLPELIRSTRIEPADFVSLWWQNQSMAWEYARPMFILFMKTLYHGIGNDNPIILHAASLVLHYLSVLLLVALAWRVTQKFGWSVAAGAIFTIYHHTVMTVQWPSAQNVVMFAFFSLLIIHAYIRASGLDVGIPAVRINQSEPGRQSRFHRDPGPTNSMHWGLFAFATFWWIVALFTRENAVLLPGFLIALDLAFGGKSLLKKRIGAYAFFAIVGIAFVIWRMNTITQPIPEVYARMPAGEGLEYAYWILAKFFHYLASSVYLFPMTVGPTGRFNPWVEAPFDTWLTLGLVALFGVLYFIWARHARGWWVWPLWIVLMMLPVLPVIATPHSGYPAGIGLAMFLAVAGAAPRLRTWQRFATGSVITLYLAGAAFFCLLSRWQWTGMIAGERYAIESVKINPPPPTATNVFFINLPFVNVYLKPGLDRALGADFETVQCHVLVYAPEPVEINEPVIVEQTSPNRLVVSSVGEPFFGGIMGRFLFEAFHEGPFFETGDRIDTEQFAVEILAADVHGISQLAFTFPKPLNDPSYCFYVSTIDTGPTRLRFSGEANDTDVSAPRLAREVRMETLSDDEIHAILRSHASALQFFDHTTTISETRQTDEHIAEWFSEHADVDAVMENKKLRHGLADLVKMREEVPHAIMWGRWFFPSDLFLSGERFPRSRAELEAMPADRLRTGPSLTKRDDPLRTGPSLIKGADRLRTGPPLSNGEESIEPGPRKSVESSRSTPAAERQP